ncbi:hypothetical protein [Enhydrobacter aerosaccus]|nr:hypothetical protein [Enhydrobacter aerosaccus]
MTLPVELAVLEGIPCRLHLRDGFALEIVLEPDLRGVMSVFEKVWALLRIGLEEVEEIGDFAEADFGFGLFRSAKFGSLPSLAYADALLVRRDLEDGVHVTPQALEAFAYLLESMAVVAGNRLGLTSERAATFGNRVAYLVSGEAIGGRDPFARAVFPIGGLESREPGWCRGKPLDAEDWRRASPHLAEVYEQFRAWERDPTLFAKERQHWYRARQFESQLRTADA